MENETSNIEGSNNDQQKQEVDQNEENEQDTTVQGEVATEVIEEVAGEHLEGEHLEGEHLEGEHTEGEHLEGEHLDGEEGLLGEGREVLEAGEEQLDEELQGEEVKEGEQAEPKVTVEEVVEEEEEGYVEEPPPDPAAPYNLTDSTEALKPAFALRPDQLAEVEQLWQFYQDHNPAYSDISGYITEKELVYMLNCLMLMTHTPEQFQELIEYFVRPPHPLGHIMFDQFVKIVTIRQREFPVEDELRSALQVLDPGRTGVVDREFLKELLAKQGHKMLPKIIDKLIKEVDMANDGTIGIEDVVGTMCIDLNREDILMLIASLEPPEENQVEEEN